MPFIITCDACKTRIRVADKAMGRRAKCPKCSASVLVVQQRRPAFASAASPDSSKPDSTWHVKVSGSDARPVPWDDIVLMAKAGELKPDSLIRNPNGDWLLVSQVDSLQQHINAPAGGQQTAEARTGKSPHINRYVLVGVCLSAVGLLVIVLIGVANRSAPSVPTADLIQSARPEAQSARESTFSKQYKPTFTIPFNRHIRDVVLSPTGKRLVIAGDERVEIWNVDERRLMVSLDHPTGSLLQDQQSFVFSANDRILAISAAKEQRSGVFVYDLSSKQKLADLRFEDAVGAPLVAVSSNGEYLYVERRPDANHPHTALEKHNLTSGVAYRALHSDTFIDLAKLCVSADGQTIAAFDRHRFYAWDTNADTLLWKSERLFSELRFDRIWLSGDKARLYIMELPTWGPWKVRARDLSTGDELPDAHFDVALCDWSPCGDWLITNDNGALRVWNLSRRTMVHDVVLEWDHALPRRSTNWTDGLRCTVAGMETLNNTGPVYVWQVTF